MNKNLEIKATHMVTIPVAGEMKVPVIADSFAEAERLAKAVLTDENQITIDACEASLKISSYDSLQDTLCSRDEIYLYETEISVAVIGEGK